MLINEWLLSERLLPALIVTELLLNICRSVKKVKDMRLKNHPIFSLAANGPKEIDMGTVKEVDWVKVIYEGEWFLGKFVEIDCESNLVCCHKKPFGMHKP